MARPNQDADAPLLADFSRGINNIRNATASVMTYFQNFTKEITKSFKQIKGITKFHVLDVTRDDDGKVHGWQRHRRRRRRQAAAAGSGSSGGGGSGRWRRWQAVAAVVRCTITY